MASRTFKSYFGTRCKLAARIGPNRIMVSYSPSPAIGLSRGRVQRQTKSDNNILRAATQRHSGEIIPSASVGNICLLTLFQPVG